MSVMMSEISAIPTACSQAYLGKQQRKQQVFAAGSIIWKVCACHGHFMYSVQALPDYRMYDGYKTYHAPNIYLGMAAT